MSESPSSWAVAPLAEIADVQLGKMLDRARNRGTPTPYLRNINVRWGSFELDDLLTVPLSDDERRTYSIEDGDLLVCEGGEPGRCAVWRSGPTEIKYQKALHRVRLRGGIVPELIAYYLRHLVNERQLEQHFTGTTIKHLPQAVLSRLSIVVPPLAEQRRIVEKLDALLARSAEARRHLARVATLAARAKQGLLGVEFERAKARGTQSVEELVTEPLRNGLSVRGQDEPPGVPALKLSALRGTLVDLSDVRYLPITDEKAASYQLREGDVLVSRGNGNRSLVGIASVVPRIDGVVIFPDTAFRVRLDPDLADPRWFAWMWSAPQAREQIEALAKTTAGIWKVSQGDLRQIRLPRVSIEEQRKITRHLASAIGRIDRLVVEAVRANHLLDRLDEALLAKAFRGELVPQDPADEPAPSLLERIRRDTQDATSSVRQRRQYPVAGPDLFEEGPLSRARDFLHGDKVSMVIMRDRTFAHLRGDVEEREPPRPPKERSRMAKSRFDEDVRERPYLASLIRTSTDVASAEALFKAADLPVVDFYKQLAWEIDNGYIRDAGARLDAA